MATNPYHLILPRRRSSRVVFASPHSGRCYDAEFLARTDLDEHSIRSSEDAFVDRLFAAAPRAGAPLLAATVPRAVIDLNRSAEEFDPALIDGIARTPGNPRVTSGLGVIPRVVANGREIYGGRLSRGEAEARVTAYWRPYHAALERLLVENRFRFGEAVLIDCHSMPHAAIEQAGPRGAPRPDVVLGDRFGAAARGDVVERVEAAFTGAGLRVVRNSPFAGAYIAQHYGRPSLRQHVVQVELDRGLYMDEARVRPSRTYRAFKRLLAGVIAEIAAIGAEDAPLAAE